MDDRRDNGRPPMPEGMETPEARDRQIMRYEETPVVTVSPVRGYVWCVFGALLGTVVLPLAAYFAAFGTAMFAARGGDARKALPLAAIVAVGLLSGAGLPDVLMGVATYLSGCLLGAHVARKGTSVTMAALLTIALGLVFILVDAWRAASLGTTIEAVFSTEIDRIVETYASQAGIASTGALETARNVALLLWPSSYLFVATISVACAQLGSRGGLRRVGADSPRLPIRHLDTPLWVIGVMATAILLCALGGVMGERGNVALMLGLNALLVARVILALDGFGVIAWLIARMGIGRIGTAIALAVAVNIELSLPVVSGIGLIDFWANFRRLARGSSPSGEPQS